MVPGPSARTEEDAPMVARRALAALAVLLAAVSVAGCAKTISGRGSLAEDAAPAGPTATGSPSESSAEPSGSPSESPSDSSSSGDINEVCRALDQEAVRTAFGTSIRLKNSQQSGCQIMADNGDSMIVAVFDFLTLAEYKHGRFKNLTVGGHPALRTDANIIYVSRSQIPSDEGLLAAYFSGLGSNGERIATSMLELLLKKYAK
jgi:predicted small secreted protein